MSSNKNKIEYIISQITNWPKVSILLSIAVLSFVGFGSYFLETNFTYRIWFEPDHPKLNVFDAFEKRFGSDELSVIVVHSPSGVFDKETITLLRDLTEEMWQTSEVIRVDSLTNFNWVHPDGDEIIVEPLVENDIEITDQLLAERKKVALNHPTIKGYLVNEKADVSVIYAKLKPSFDGSPVYEDIVESIREKLKKYEGQGDHKFYLTGNPMLNHAFKESTERDFYSLVPFVLLVTLAFLIFSFRNIAGIVLPFVVIISTVICTIGAGGWAGIKINNITSVVPQFMIAIAIAVAVHLMVSFFMYYNKGMDKIEAIRASGKKNFIPTLLTAISTTIGFLSFTTSPIPPIFNMGAMAGLGTMFSWLFAYTILIPLVVLIPIKRKANVAIVDEVVEVTPRAMRLTELIERWRIFILVTSVIVAIVSLILAFKVEVNSDPFNYFTKEYSLTQATDFIEKNLGGAVGNEIIVESGKAEGIKDPEFLKKVEKYQDWIANSYKVTKTISIIDILKDMNKTLNRGDESYYKLPNSQEMIAQQLFLYTLSLPQGMDINDRVTLENDAIRLTSMWTIHDSTTALKQVKAYEDKAKEMGLNAYVTGKMPLYQSLNDTIVSSFKISMSLAIVLVALLLIIGLKSIKMGLFSMIPNTLPLIVGAGFVKLFNQPLDIGTVIVGSVCLGIAVDDTIHFLSNFNKYRVEGDSVKVAIAKIFSSTAPALITTTVVLVSAFGTFIFATFAPNQNFGIFVSIILSGALIIDLTFVPALLMTFDVTSGSSKKEQ